MKLPFFKVEYIKIPSLNFSDYFTIYYNDSVILATQYYKIGMGIFSKRKKKYFKDADCPCNECCRVKMVLSVSTLYYFATIQKADMNKAPFKRDRMYFNGTLQNFKKMANLHKIARACKIPDNWLLCISYSL